MSFSMNLQLTAMSKHSILHAWNISSILRVPGQLSRTRKNAFGNPAQEDRIFRTVCLDQDIIQTNTPPKQLLKRSLQVSASISTSLYSFMISSTILHIIPVASHVTLLSRQVSAWPLSIWRCTPCMNFHSHTVSFQLSMTHHRRPYKSIRFQANQQGKEREKAYCHSENSK